MGLERQLLAPCLHRLPVLSRRPGHAVYEPHRAKGMLMNPGAEVEAAVEQAVPDALLLPLLEVAADVLKSLDPVDAPASLRPLLGFDRRRMLTGPGPRQLRRAIST